MNDKCLMIKLDQKIEEYKCNICSEIIKDNEIVALKCNVKKHIFCYECISDWFNESDSNKIYRFQNVKNMCPMCRKPGGKLPFLDNEFNDNKIFNKNVNYDICNGLNTNCGYFMKKSNKCCFNLGKKEFNFRCGKHKNMS